MDSFSSLGLFLAIYGSLWLTMAPIAPYGSLWHVMAPYGSYQHFSQNYDNISQNYIHLFARKFDWSCKLLKSWVTILMVLRRCTVKNVIVNTTSASLFGRHFNGTLKVPGSGDLLRYIITAQNAHEAVRLAKKASLSFHGAHLFNLVQSTFDTWLLGRWVSWSMGWMTVWLLFLTNQQYWVDRMLLSPIPLLSRLSIQLILIPWQ